MFYQSAIREKQPAGENGHRQQARQLLENPGCRKRYLNPCFLQKDLFPIGQDPTL
jgi:hypothetical protein